jgi:hypothetical protein
MSKLAKLMLLCTLVALFAIQAQAFPGGMAGQQGAAPAAANQAPPIKGKVVETMNAGGYTYVCLESDGQKRWAAMPPAEVKVGETVELAPGMVMNNFRSNALDRTFDSIVFSGGLIRK